MHQLMRRIDARICQADIGHIALPTEGGSFRTGATFGFRQHPSFPVSNSAGSGNYAAGALAHRRTGHSGKAVHCNAVTYEPSARVRKHYHTSQVFFYILQGTMAVQDEGKEPIMLKSGDYLLIKPGTVHAHWNASPTEKLVFTEFILVDEGQRSVVFVEP